MIRDDEVKGQIERIHASIEFVRTAQHDGELLAEILATLSLPANEPRLPPELLVILDRWLERAGLDPRKNAAGNDLHGALELPRTEASAEPDGAEAATPSWIQDGLEGLRRALERGEETIVEAWQLTERSPTFRRLVDRAFALHAKLAAAKVVAENHATRELELERRLLERTAVGVSDGRGGEILFAAADYEPGTPASVSLTERIDMNPEDLAKARVKR